MAPKRKKASREVSPPQGPPSDGRRTSKRLKEARANLLPQTRGRKKAPQQQQATEHEPLDNDRPSSDDNAPTQGRANKLSTIGEEQEEATRSKQGSQARPNRKQNSKDPSKSVTGGAEPGDLHAGQLESNRPGSNPPPKQPPKQKAAISPGRRPNEKGKSALPATSNGRAQKAPSPPRHDQPPPPDEQAGAEEEAQNDADAPNEDQAADENESDPDAGNKFIRSVDENPDSSQSLKEYVRKQPVDISTTREIIRQLIERHGYGADFSWAKQSSSEYIDNPDLIEESWAPPYPAALLRNEVATYSRTKVLQFRWRQKKMADACRNYIQKALTDDRQYDEAGLKERIEACVRLTTHHVITNDQLWATAPPIERYLTGHFTHDEKWPLNEEQLLAKWHAIENRLKAQAPDDQPTNERFQKLFRYAKRMLQQAAIFLGPAHWNAGVRPQRYVDEFLAPEISDDAYELLKPSWTHDLSELDDPDERESYRVEFEELPSNGPTFPYTYEEAVWKRKWAAIEGAASASVKAQGRVRDIRALAEEILDKHFEFIQPPDFGQRPITEHDVDTLWAEFRRQQEAYIREAWDIAIFNAPDGKQRVEMSAEKHTVLNRLKEGEQPWRPGEDRPSGAMNEVSKLGFDGDRVGVPRAAGHWNLKTVIGAGTFGRASLWIKYDAELKVVDRLIIKDILMGEHWHDADQYWYTYRDRMAPLEEVAPRMLTKATDSDNILLCIGSGIYDKFQLCRIYSEYCPHGSLRDLVEAHISIQRNPLVDQDGNKPDHRIPPRALWAIFEGLASAICHMQSGSLPDLRDCDRDRTKSNPPMLHCDIKPENIFLGPLDAGGLWPGIPTTKLGDFGLVKFTDQGDPPVNHPGGTTGWRAPEAFRIENQHNSYAVQASDIWAIGMIMLSLVNLETHPTQLTVLDSRRKFPPPVLGGGAAFYPRVLLDLIQSCLQRDPKDRPAADALWWDIKREVATMRGLRGECMKRSPVPEGEVVLGFNADRYLVWTDG